MADLDLKAAEGLIRISSVTPGVLGCIKEDFHAVWNVFAHEFRGEYFSVDVSVTDAALLQTHQDLNQELRR